MRKNRILLASTLSLICLAIISIITINAFNPEPAAYCAGNVASANGSGHNENLTLSFGAFDHGEGNITGQATFIEGVKNTKVTIDVECVSVTVNLARIGGTVRKSTDPVYAPGEGVSFFVQDNGEGDGAKADGFTALIKAECGKKVEAKGLLQSDSGNIQVRFVAPDKDCTKCPFGTHCAGNGECVGGGGGSGDSCPVGTRNCCGTCLPESEACPVECSPPQITQD
jgi:hypothetical protein